MMKMYVFHYVYVTRGKFDLDLELFKSWNEAKERLDKWAEENGYDPEYEYNCNEDAAEWICKTDTRYEYISEDYVIRGEILSIDISDFCKNGD